MRPVYIWLRSDDVIYNEIGKLNFGICTILESVLWNNFYNLFLNYFKKRKVQFVVIYFVLLCSAIIFYQVALLNFFDCFVKKGTLWENQFA